MARQGIGGTHDLPTPSPRRILWTMRNGKNGNHVAALARARRQKVIDRLQAPLLVRAAPELLRNGDVHYTYRQDSNFHYLTGFDEPEAILLAIPTGKGHKTILFVRPRDKAREIWDGPRAGTRGAVRDLGADEAHEVGKFWEVFAELAKGWDRLAYPLGTDESFDDELLGHFAKRFTGRPRRNEGMPTLVDPRPRLHELRLLKTPEEIAVMQRACDITVAGHRVAMAIARPGMFEYEVQAEIEATFRRDGSPRNGYDSIVASGPNACILHYVKNDRRIRKGELVLVDAGAEFGGYTGDVTRVFPVAGRFTPAQRAVYEVVLRCQKKCVALVRPGTPVRKLLTTSWHELTRGLIELGVLRGKPTAKRIARYVKQKKYFDWYMHGLGHWLGMDVHDVGAYEHMDGEPIRIEPGMVTTIEPGLYFRANDRRLPAELRGIGVRIEDDVLCTRGGPRVLTAGAPKEVEDVEAMVAG
jgi:Xaa-Pro aminopeptidase